MADPIYDMTGQGRTLEDYRNALLKSGDGGGTFDDMEPRVRQLENDMSFIKGKLEDMPTKDWMNTRLLAYMSASVGVIGLMIAIAGLAVKFL